MEALGSQRKCIFCLTEKSQADFAGEGEHVFPEAIGGTFRIYTVCRPCNSRLGSDVDAALTNQATIQLARMCFSLPGKSGAVPNPLGSGVLDEQGGLPVQVRVSDGSSEIYARPNIFRRGLPDGNEAVRVIIDAKDRVRLAAIVNKILSRGGHPSASSEQIEAAMQSERIVNPSVKTDFRIDLRQYKRTILKIAYEMATHWLGDAYLDDPTAPILRDAIFDDAMDDRWVDRHPIRGDICFLPDNFRLPLDEPGANSHQVLMFAHGGTVVGVIMIFQVFVGTVFVSEEASRYAAFTSKFMDNSPLTGRIVERTAPEEMLRALAACGAR